MMLHHDSPFIIPKKSNSKETIHLDGIVCVIRVSAYRNFDMTTTFSPISLSGIQNRTQDDHGLEGVIGALESICELESRLRQAIQQTHPLSTSLDWDFEAADRERKALLSIRCVWIFLYHEFYFYSMEHGQGWSNFVAMPCVCWAHISKTRLQPTTGIFGRQVERTAIRCVRRWRTEGTSVCVWWSLDDVLYGD